MAWLEVSGSISHKKAEHCQEILENLGAVAVSLIDPGQDPLLEPLPGTTPLWENLNIIGLFEATRDREQLAQQLQQQCPYLTFEISILPDQDWTRAWLEHFHPQRFGEHFWIIPTEYPNPPDLGPNPVVLTLDPGLAFGTGTHPTTALCLSWLANNDVAQYKVLDYGCGSGILGIAACLLGASTVWAIDQDPQAITATRSNAEQNGISPDQLQVQLNTQPEAIPVVDLILANILAEPLIALAPLLQHYCRPGGKIVLSGILDHQAMSVQNAYTPWFHFEPITHQDGWILLIGNKIA